MSCPSRLLPIVSLLLLLPACSRKPRIENVLLICLDSTRADHVDSGQGGRAWTPNLRRFAAGSWVFENAYSPIPQTLPAHLALLSGRLPHELGVFGNEYIYEGRWPLLQQALQRRGWHTVGIVSLGALAKVTGFARGFNRFFDQLHESGQFSAPAGKVSDLAIAELERSKKKKFFLFVHYSDPHSPYAAPDVQGRFTIELDQRLLATFNAYTGAIVRLRLPLLPGTHRLRFRSEAPGQEFKFFIIRRLQAKNGELQEMRNLEYSPEYYGGSHLLHGSEGSAVIRSRSAAELQLFQVIPILTAHASVDHYRREVEYLDSQVGRLLRALEKSPAARCTAVVLFADHGEGLGERDSYSGHVRFLNRQFIHVPLMARFPGEAPRRFTQAVGLQSVASWLISALGIENSRIRNSGIPWAELRRGRAGRDPVCSFTFAPASGEDRCSLISWPYQLIVSRHPQTGRETREYYDLRLDSYRKLAAIPPELVFRQEPGMRRRLEEFRFLWRAAFSRRSLQPSRLSRRRIEELQTLGYLNQP